MSIAVSDAINLLNRTPKLLRDMLEGLPDHLIQANEGGETWSPYDVVGHLIHGDKTDWIPRLRICLSDTTDKTFQPFDRFAQFEDSKDKTLQDLLSTFEQIRTENITALKEMKLRNEDYQRRAVHPALGEVNLGQLLTTWVVHDLDHIYQVSRILAHQFRDDVGPWKAYLRIVQ